MTLSFPVPATINKPITSVSYGLDPHGYPMVHVVAQDGTTIVLQCNDSGIRTTELPSGTNPLDLRLNFVDHGI